MHDYNLISIPLLIGIKLNLDMCLSYNDDYKEMYKDPYPSFFGILMYAMVFTCLDISQAMGVLRKFMSNPSK